MLGLIGELSSAAGWMASHFSRAVLKMCDVGDDGEIGGETKNKKAKQIAAEILGRPAERREVMRMAGFNLWLVGEVYIGACPKKGPMGRDLWFAVSTDDIQRVGGEAYVDLGRGKVKLEPGNSLLVRSWTPHPNKAADAYSGAFSVRLILRELEKLTLYVFSQVDSRLASGGVFVVPAGMSSESGAITARDLMLSFVETASDALKGEGTAAGIVPIVLEVPQDTLGKLQYLTFSSELSQQAVKLRQEAVDRLANSLDIPAEEINGGIGDSNHWASFQIGPDAVKKHIEPLLSRFCLALQSGWVDHALEASGLDPNKYHIWYDTTPLIVRPQRFQEALELWREGRLSSEALLKAAGFYESDAPEAGEDVRRYLRELVFRDPQLFNQASVRALLGVTEEMIPETMGAPALEGQLLTDKGTPPPPPPKPETLPEKPVTGRVPVSREREPRGIAASAAVYDPSPLALLTLADAVSLRALELAGGRLLDHRTRGQLKEVPRHEIHTRVKVSRGTHDLEKLLSGWGELLPELATFVGISEDRVPTLTRALRRHCEDTLLSGEPHNRERMVLSLQIARLLDGLQ
jgi:hypothetical protein